MSKCPECGATNVSRDEKDASLLDHLKDQHRVDHGSALAIRGLQREIDELKKNRLVGSNKKVTKSNNTSLFATVPYLPFPASSKL